MWTSMAIISASTALIVIIAIDYASRSARRHREFLLKFSQDLLDVMDEKSPSSQGMRQLLATSAFFDFNLRQLKSSKKAKRVKAIKALGKIGTPNVVQPLLSQAGMDDSEIQE